MPKNFNAWPKGWPKSLNYPDFPVHSFLDQTAARVPDRIAIHFSGMELTYGELKNLSDRFASALEDLGVKRGDRIGHSTCSTALSSPSPITLSCAWAQTFTPLSPLLSPREAKRQLLDSGATILISLDLLYPGIKSVTPETNVSHCHHRQPGRLLQCAYPAAQTNGQNDGSGHPGFRRAVGPISTLHQNGSHRRRPGPGPHLLYRRHHGACPRGSC